MTKVFPARRLQSYERTYDPETCRMAEWESKDSYFVVESEAEDYIDETLGQRFGVSPFFLINLTRDPETWAAVFYTDIIQNSDEVLTARAELRDQLGFAVYGEAHPGMANPPLGAMAVKSVAALEAASSRHLVFQKAWDALRSCDPHENWVAIIDL